MGTPFKKLAATLAISLVLVHFVPAQERYARAHLWEKEIKAFQEQDAQTSPARNGIVFVGSSSIRGWRTVAEDFPGFAVLNRGFGGSHLEDVVFYAPQAVLPHRPKLIVLYAGENDLTAGKTIADVFSDFKKFVSLVHDSLPETRIIFISLKPSPARWNLREKFQQLNAMVRAEAEKDRRLLFVDVWPPMTGADGEPRKDLFLNDRLHMKPEAYRIWRDTLAPHIKAGMKGNFPRSNR